MAREPKGPGRLAEAALRKAFKDLEEQPVPVDIGDHVDKIAGPKKSRPDRRS